LILLFIFIIHTLSARSISESFSLTSRKVFNLVIAEYGDFLILMRVVSHQSFMGVAIMGAQSKRGALSA